MDLLGLIKEHLVEVFSDPRVQDSYVPLVAEKLAARMSRDRWVKTAEMARLIDEAAKVHGHPGCSSRQYLIVLAKRHPDLRALAQPKPWEVQPGQKTPDLEWPEQETLAWFKRRHDG